MFAAPIAKAKSALPQRSAVPQRHADVSRKRVPVQENADAGHITGATAASWDFGNISVFPSSGRPVPIQTKLKLGAVNDPLEHEADRVAEQMMGSPAASMSVSTAPPQISRKCVSCGQEEEKIQRKPEGTAMAAPVSAGVHQTLRSPGQPLDGATRAYFEPRFGQDFSTVRVHSDAAAQQSAGELGAFAYTVGPDIVFGAGAFAPQTGEGRRLIAHELTHVVQQSQGDVSIQRAPNSGAPSPFKMPNITIADVDQKSTDPNCQYAPDERARSATATGLLDFDVATGGTYGIYPSDATLVVDFKVDDGSLRSSAAKDLQNLIKLGAFPAVNRSSMEIVGYSDCVGWENHNKELRRQRTNAVSALLPGMQTRSANFDEYLIDNASPEHRALNRSVIIKDTRGLTPKLIPPGPVKRPSPTPIPILPNYEPGPYSA